MLSFYAFSALNENVLPGTIFIPVNTGSAHSTPWNIVNTVAQMTGKRALT